MNTNNNLTHDSDEHGVDKNKPWLSIIIPIYNAEKYLAKCLNSILKQTYTDYEVLLVDDGSTDSSSEICNKYSANPKFRYIKKDNGGSYQTRLYGAENALGTYIMFCDADDYYSSKHAFERLHDELIDKKYDAVQYGYTKKYNHIYKVPPGGFALRC